MSLLIVITAVVLALVLLIAAPFTIAQRIDRAPERPRAPWDRRDMVRVEAEAMRLLSGPLDGLSRDEELTDLARHLALERAAGNEPASGTDAYRRAVADHCRRFGGELLDLSGAFDGKDAPIEEQLAVHLVESLGGPRRGGADHFGLGVAYLKQRAVLVLVLGRLAWRWREPPPPFGDPGFPIRAVGKPATGSMAELSLEGPDGMLIPVDVPEGLDEYGPIEVVLGPQPGICRLLAGPETDRVEVARIRSGPLS